MTAAVNPVEGWEYPCSLPQQHAGFNLELENCRAGLLYHIFTYRNPVLRRSAGIVFDQGTAEYMVRIKVGLIEFCDVRFIHSDRQSFEQVLKTDLLPLLEMLRQCDPARMETLFRNKGIAEWSCDSFLPLRLHGFERTVCPKTCVQVTNGSYLILDYSDFGCDSSLRFFHNVFRDDFFAEFLICGVPEATQEYDSKTLPDFETRLKMLLDSSLVKLRDRIDSPEVSLKRSASLACND